MAAEARAAGRDRHDRMVQLWGLLVLAESRLRTDPGDPAIAAALEEAEPLLTSGIAVADLVRFHVAAARFQLAAGRTPDAWREIRAAAALAGPEPSFAPYTLEAHAGIPEVCLALLERDKAVGVDPAEVRATAAAGLRRLRPTPARSPWPGPERLPASAGCTRSTAAKGPPTEPGRGPSGRPSGSPCPGSWPTPTTSSAAI